MTAFKLLEIMMENECQFEFYHYHYPLFTAFASTRKIFANIDKLQSTGTIWFKMDGLTKQSSEIDRK